jgi:hypothetical protein
VRKKSKTVNQSLSAILSPKKNLLYGDIMTIWEQLGLSLSTTLLQIPQKDDLEYPDASLPGRFCGLGWIKSRGK